MSPIGRSNTVLDSNKKINMPYKRKFAEEEIHRELAQDSDSDCDSELEECFGPDEEGDEGSEVVPLPGNEPGTGGEDENEPGPSGRISTIQEEIGGRRNTSRVSARFRFRL
jgi:hypothetical protein